MTSTYRLDLDRLTVIATDSRGESFDLNAGGEPCRTADELRAFVVELFEQGGLGGPDADPAARAAVRDALLADLA